jgi:tRNA A-37 threonylcarbamoyl transferase component Bud32
MDQYPSKGQITFKEEGTAKFAIKAYNRLNSSKWYIIALFSSAIYPIAASPQSRLERELAFFDYKIEGVKKPRVVSYDLEEKILKREYLEGEIPYDKPDLVSKALCYIHRAGYVLGDTKIENFLVDKEDSVSVIDAEQAVGSFDYRLRAWDLLLLFGSMAYKHLYDLDKYGEKVEKIIHAYNDWDNISGEIYNPLNSLLLAVIPLPHLLRLASAISARGRES